MCGEYHGGSAEKGKDIICHYQDILGEKKYVAIVVKKTNIHGSVGKRSNASEILYQVEQALNEPFNDMTELTPVDISECWVVTSGFVKNTALESIRGKLQKSNLDKVTRFIDRGKLFDLINQHMPEYWHRERFILALAHEMYSPVFATRSRADILARYPEKLSRKKVVDYAQDIVLDMELLGRLIDQARVFQSDEPRINISSVNPSELLKKAIYLLNPMFKNMGIKLNYMLDEIEGLKSIQVDEYALEQVLFIILKNAAKYGASNDPEVIVVASSSEQHLIIRVQDFGIGIPKGLEEQIFQPGFQAQNAVQQSGSAAGIGLTVARKLVRLHDGEIRVTNHKNPTEFSIYLPLGASK